MNAVKKRIFIVDDHPDVRMGLRALLGRTPDLRVCGECADAGEALAKVTALQPDLAIIDVSLRDSIDGFELTKQLLHKAPGMRVVILSLYEGPKHLANAKNAGATACISKTAPGEKVVETIREVLGGAPPPVAASVPPPAEPTMQST